MMAGYSLQDFNTLRLQSSAECLVEPTRVDALQDALAEAHQHNWPVTVLGAGSNVVLKPYLPGCVIRPQWRGMRIDKQDATSAWVIAEAGETFDDVVQWSLAQGLQGLENLSLIPGTVGAAPVQNIGAYGVELADSLQWVDVVRLDDGKLERLTNDACEFAYRDSLFKRQAGRYLIVRVCLRLTKQQGANGLVLHYADLQDRFLALPSAQQNAKGVRQLVVETRQQKLPDPVLLPNAGSFFKNPLVDQIQADRLKAQYPQMPCHAQADGHYKLAAGWLIDQAGFKGKREGGLAMHERQALVMVNHGQSTQANDVLKFANIIKTKVNEQFGVCLQQEPVILPADTR